MQKARRRALTLRPLVNERFQVLFHSPVRGSFHLSLTVYWSTIGLPGVFSLAGWSPRIRTGFLVPRPTQVVPSTHARCPYGTVTLCGRCFHSVPVPACVFGGTPTTPKRP